MAIAINRFLSQKLRFYTFIAIVLLLLVHGYNLNETYLQPFTTVNEPLSFTTFFEYFLANGILRFRIPLLFIISGYIYASKDNAPYMVRANKRAVSLPHTIPRMERHRHRYYLAMAAASCYGAGGKRCAYRSTRR